MADYLKSILGIFDNTDDWLKEKARQAAASAKQFVTKTAPQAIQKKSEQYIPGGISGGVNRVKSLAAGKEKDSLFVFSPKTLRNQANVTEAAASKWQNPYARGTAAAYTELLRGKAKGAENVATGVKEAVKQPGWWNKTKGVAKAGVGAFQFAQPDIAVATGPVRAAVSTVAGAAINAAMAKIQGKDVAEAAGKGGTQGLRFAAVTKFTDPLIAKAAGVVAPTIGFWGKQAATRAITAIGNVVEDEIIAKLDQVKPTNADRAVSLAIGGALGGNDELFDQAKRQIKAMLGNSTDSKSVAKATKVVLDRLRDEGGRYAPEPPKPAVPEPKVDWTATDPNQPNKLVRTVDGLPETPAAPKPPRNMTFSPDPTRPRTLLRDQRQAAFGLAAGFEPELDEQGNPTGKMRYNPEKGLAGIAVAGFLTTGKHQEAMKQIINGSKTPDEAITSLKNYVENGLKELSLKIQGGDTSKETMNEAKGMRAAINKLAYQLAGVDPSAGKQEKVYYEAMKNDPDVGPVINELEWQITNVDDVLAGKPATEAIGMRPGELPTTRSAEEIMRDFVKAADSRDIEGLKKIEAEINSNPATAGYKDMVAETMKKIQTVKPQGDIPLGENWTRFADDANKDTYASRGGTWFTNEQGTGAVKDAMGAENPTIGGSKQFSSTIKPQNPLVIKDADLENGSFAVINSGYENYLQPKTVQIANKLYNDVMVDQVSDSEMDTRIMNAMFDAGIPEEQARNVLGVLSKNRFNAAMDLIISKDLKDQGYDALVLNNEGTGGQHIFSFKETPILEAGAPQNPPTGAITPEVPTSGETPRKTAQQIIDEAQAKALNPDDYKGATASEFNQPRKPKSAQEIIESQSQGSTPKTETPLPSPAPKMQEFFQGQKAPDTQIQPKSETQITPNTAPSEISISRKTTQASPLNVNRLDLTDEQKGRVSADQIKEVRDILGDKEIEKIAKAAGIDTKTNTIDQTAEKIAGQLNVRRQVVELETKRTQMIADGAPEEELVAIAKQIQETSRISREQGTDIARQLSARRIIANEINTPMQRVFQLLDKAGVNPESYTKDAAKLDFTDGNAVVDFYRKYVPPSAEDWLTLVRYNSMLSSPNTQINNFFSNLEGSLIVAPIEKEITAGIDALKSALTGSPRQYASGEGVAYAKGYVESVGAAVKKFSEVMQGKVLSSNLDYREVPLTQAGDKLRKTENVLKFPMKVLEAFDQFFTTLTKGGSEKSLEFRAGKGIAVKDAAARAEEEAAKRLFRSDLGDNEGSVVLDAMDTIANVVQRLKGNKNVVVRNLARFSLPFLRTPTNILKQGLEYSPAGVLTLPGAKDKTEQLAKAVMGTSVGIAVATMVSSDRLTWAEPTSQKQKNAFRAAGMQPYSIKVGDKWISYSKVHPAIAFPMALVAAVKDSQENGNLDDTQADQILAGASKWVQFFADQSYVKSIGDLVAATKGDIEGPARIAGNYVQQLVPFRALSGWITRLIDPYQRRVDPDGSALEKQFDYLKTQIPFLSMTVPAREDQFGQPIENQNRFLNAFSPNRVTTEQPEAKKEFEWMQEQSKMDKEQRQLKEKLDRETKTSITVPKAGAAESAIIPGKGSPTAPAARKELTKQEKTKVKTLLEYGKDVPEEDLVSYYLSDVKGSTSDTGYKKTIRTKSLLTKYESIETDENLSQAQKEVVQAAIASETGLSSEKIDYYTVAKLDNGLKYEKAQEDIAAFTDRKEVIKYLAKGRELVAGQMFSTPGVIDAFYEDGYITKAEAKYLKALKFDEKTGKAGMDRDYKSAGAAAQTKEMKAFFKGLVKTPELAKIKPTKSQIDWTSSANTPEGPSLEDASIERPKAYVQPKMADFFKPKATKLSTGEAQAAVNAVRGSGAKNEHLKLRYASVRR